MCSQGPPGPLLGVWPRFPGFMRWLPAPGGRAAHAEHGEADEVVRGGAQIPVLCDALLPAHPGAAAAVPAADKVSQPSFDLGSVQSWVGSRGSQPASRGLVAAPARRPGVPRAVRR